MRTAITTLLAVSALAGHIEPQVSPRRLVWSDEFNGRNGSAPDPKKWVFDIGGNGFGNQELQYHTDRTPQNVVVSDGHLTIRAVRETYRGPDGVTRGYTSARLNTRGLFAWQYGRFEARIRIPTGRGLWPAFWMLGDDFPTVGWPLSGEIDVLENIGSEPTTLHATVHGPGYSHDRGITSSHTLPGRVRLADDFHVYAVDWERDTLRFSVDGVIFKTITPADLPAGARWVFDHPFFLILNVAVGGLWPGSPDESTTFPQTMLVDYVRVYQTPTR